MNWLILLAIIILVIVIMQLNDVITGIRNTVVAFVKWVWSLICSPFKKDRTKAPKVKKVKVPRVERKRLAKNKKLRLKVYNDYVENRAIYVTEYVNANQEVQLLEKEQANAREKEELKKQLKAK